jgi:hypothetical protein
MEDGMKTCSRHGREVHAKLSAGKPQWQKPVGRPRHRWEDNNEMDLKEIGWVCTGFIWCRKRTNSRLLQMW